MNEGAGTIVPRFAKLSIVVTAAARVLNVELFAIFIAILLPWSTSGVLIFAALWILALIPTLDIYAFLRSLRRPVCLAPVALFALASVGTLWSDAPWGARLHAIGPTTKLLVLPLLLYHFERTGRGVRVFVAFLLSATLLMLASWLVAFVPKLALKPYIEAGTVVKNHIDQSHVFALCAVALAYPISILFKMKRFSLAGLFAVVALGFAANMAFIDVSRTALITIPVMIGVFLLHRFELRSIIAALSVLALLGVLGWSTSPQLKSKTASFFPPYRLHELEGEPTSIELRFEFWRKSIGFFAEAPLIGHGTGSTRRLFEQAAVGQTGAAAEVVGNPHNQTLNVAVQWGIVGVAALYAMWLLHLVLFRGEGLANWLGSLVVVQNFISSLFNSHLFDFQEGWIYVLGVGVAGGMALRAKPEQF
jgi:O-antigen ligase